MLIPLIFSFCTFVLRFSNGFFPSSHSLKPKSLQIFSSSLSSPDLYLGKYTIRLIDDDKDMSRAAVFLSQTMYEKTIEDDEVPVSQRNELMRLEKKDLIERYGRLVGKRKYPAALIALEEEGNLVGVVGLDSQIISIPNKKFRKLYPLNTPPVFDDEIVLVLSNLAIRQDKRGQGLAKLIVNFCHKLAKEDWSLENVYLLVDETNTSARKLYNSLGYTEVYRDTDATCIIAGQFRLQTAPCVNLCMKKSLLKEISFINNKNNVKTNTNIFNSFITNLLGK